ncbi:hypothetical protein Purlil1_5799 [Purpureocillium lilacinum]|uniref:Uncharacterized protein n=1 Tax=Purpureocillium lilacinum TaxID=33203 RepID=A0ABR0C017_PURLI|nr:hypothetical protein Purlil1_5799 [Purpureocillium lilacinum]
MCAGGGAGDKSPLSTSSFVNNLPANHARANANVARAPFFPDTDTRQERRAQQSRAQVTDQQAPRASQAASRKLEDSEKAPAGKAMPGPPVGQWPWGRPPSRWHGPTRSTTSFGSQITDHSNLITDPGSRASAIEMDWRKSPAGVEL